MKIKSILLLALLIVLCGCSNINKITCSVNQGGYSSVAVITIEKGEATDIVVTNTYNTEEQTKSACGILSLTTKDLECDDKTVVISNYQDTLSSKEKDRVIEHFETNKYTCKNN